MADILSGKVKRVWDLKDPWSNEHGSFTSWGVEFEEGASGKFNVAEGYDPKFVAGETHFYSIKKHATGDKPALLKWEKDPSQGGGRNYGGGKKGGYGGRAHDPNLEMVKNAAVQAAHVLTAQMQGTGEMVDHNAVTEMVSHFFFAQKDLYDATKPAPQAPAQNTPTQPPPPTEPPVSTAVGAVVDDEDDLPF